jgi:Rad3-related DNA helicase
MSNKNKWLIEFGAITVIATFVAAYFYIEDQKKRKRIIDLEQDNLKLILESIKNNHNLSDELKRQLTKLVKQFENIDIKVANEISQSLQLIQIGQTENAIEDLVKIIEHLLTIHYQNDSDFKAWLKKEKKKFDLFNLLTFCKTDNKITEIEYQFFLAIKKVRDKEDHTLDLKLDPYLNASGLITAIGGILKLTTIVYPHKKIE